MASRRETVAAGRRARTAGLASLCVGAALCLAALGCSGRGRVGPGSDRAALAEPGDPAELFPDVPDTSDCDHDGDAANDRIASQRIFNDSNDNGIFERGVDTAASTQLIGCFIFHPEHNHWHFEEFERYELRRIKSGKVLASSEKVSFCLLDTGRFGDILGTPSSPHYGPCNEDVTMGLSVGWSDIYQSNLFGQELDVRGLPAGRYCLAMVADPGGRVEETNETDNGRSTVVQIAGPTATDLDRRCPGESR